MRGAGAPRRREAAHRRHRDGKLDAADVARWDSRRGDEHQAQPRVVSITQSTELGTVYTLEQTRAIAEAAHAREMYLHVDGARLANAAAALDLSLAELTTEAGVDVVSFGGTKNGLVFGEAVVFCRSELAEHFATPASSSASWPRRCASSPPSSRR